MPNVQQVLKNPEMLSPYISQALIKKNKLEVYLQKMNQLYSAKLNQYIYDQLVLFCASADTLLSDKNREIYDITADLINQLMPIFESYGNLKTKIEKDDDDQLSKLSWTIVDTPEFIRDLEKRMEGNEKFSVDLGKVVRNFYEYLLRNIDKWYDENQEAVEDLNTFIYRQFNNVLDNSMDFFFELIAESENKTLNQYCTDIIKELSRQADVRYPINSSFASNAVPQPAYSFVSIPDNAPALYKAATDAVNATSVADGAKSIVKRSGVRDRIFMMTFMSATPLSLNADIKQFYSTYMQHRDSQRGLHLYVPTKVGKQTSDIDWRDLPSPYPESEWTDFFDQKEHETNEVYREVLKKAIKYGYVVEDTHNCAMTLYWGDMINPDEIAKKYDIDLNSEATIKQRNAEGFIREMKGLRILFVTILGVLTVPALSLILDCRELLGRAFLIHIPFGVLAGLVMEFGLRSISVGFSRLLMALLFAVIISVYVKSTYTYTEFTDWSDD